MIRHRFLAAVMGLEAVSLAVMSTLHLTGALGERGNGAGIAEAVIGVALAAGAVALWRRGPDGRTLATQALAFAIAGFLIGLSFTLRGGSAVDLAYHATGLPLLVLTLAALRRQVTGAR